MFTIQTLNAISPVGLAKLPKNLFEVAVETDAPDGILVRSADLLNADFQDNLLAIARAGAGVNNIPLERCSEQGIVVFNTPGANANAVAELVVGMLIAGSRNVPAASAWVQGLAGDPGLKKDVEKGKKQFVGNEIAGKTLGVIGLGAIGALVCNIALDLGMDVYGYDPFLSVDAALRLDRHVHVVKNVDDLYRVSDYITIHIPYNNDTKDFINAEAISKMKGQVRVLNLARGGLVNDDDMIEALESGRVARYITDFPDEKLLGRENILCVPHLGASTPEAEDNCAYMAAKQLTDYLENGNITNSVNYPAVSMPRTSVSRVCVHHKNVKEILSKILAIVSSQGVNIAHMQDQSRGEYAYLVLDLDDTLSPEAVELIRRVSGVIRVRVL